MIINYNNIPTEYIFKVDEMTSAQSPSKISKSENLIKYSLSLQRKQGRVRSANHSV